MKLMAWNFLEGGLVCNKEGLMSPHPERREAAQRLVKSVSPDVLIVNEALHAQSDQDEDYAALFDFPFGVAGRYDGSWGNAILSRWPVVEVLERTIHAPGSTQNRGFLAVRVETPEGLTWVSTYHPHPHRRPHKRAEDFSKFLALLDGPAVLAGDLNAVMPEDTFDAPSMVKTFERFQPAERAAISVAAFQEAGRLLSEEVLPAQGWRVASIPYQPTIPTALIRHEGDLGMRLDHVLVSKHWREQLGSVLSGVDADAASDHYPILIDLVLTPSAY